MAKDYKFLKIESHEFEEFSGKVTSDLGLEKAIGEWTCFGWEVKSIQETYYSYNCARYFVWLEWPE